MRIALFIDFVAGDPSSTSLSGSSSAHVRVQHLRVSSAAADPVQGNSGHVFRFEGFACFSAREFTVVDFKDRG